MTHLSQRHRGFAGVLSLLCLSFGCGDSSPSQRDDDGAAQDASSQGSPDGGSPGRGDDAGMATDGGTDGGEDHETLEPLRTEIGAPMGAPVTATIGAAGGTLVSPDGVLSLEIPAGALAADTAVGIQPIAHLAPGGVGAGYELTPEGTTFAKPVTLRFKYTEQTTAGSAPTFLGVAVQNADRFWELQWETAKLDKAASSLSVETTHFSRWGVVQHVHLEPASATLETKQMAAFYVSLCADLPEKVPGSQERVLMTTCRKMPVRYGSRTLSNWAVDGISGGNATVGTVTPNVENGYYTAPASKPTPSVVTLSVDGRNPFTGVTEPLTAKIEVIDGNRPYSGYMTFTASNGGYTLTADATITWVPTEDLGDVRRYRPTGSVQAEVTYAGCQPATATLTYAATNTGELVIYTETNAAYANQYQFSATATGMVTILCGDDPPTPVPTTVAATGTGGSCSGGPPFAPLTNVNHLQGSGPCKISSLTASEWSFVRDQSPD